eukprot:UN28048
MQKGEKRDDDFVESVQEDLTSFPPMIQDIIIEIEELRKQQLEQQFIASATPIEKETPPETIVISDDGEEAIDEGKEQMHVENVQPEMDVEIISIEELDTPLAEAQQSKIPEEVEIIDIGGEELSDKPPPLERPDPVED